jgi:hypothetical protein
MYVSPLIRFVDRVETPAQGRWTIAANQPVLGARRDFARRVAGTGRTVDGQLVMAKDPLGSSLELTIAADDLPFPEAPTLHYRATALVPTREGIWLLNGDLAAGSVARPLRSIVRYQGVYRNGERAAAWLTLHARVDLSSYPLGKSMRRFFIGRYLDITAELNADAPMTLASASGRLNETAC